MSSDSVGVCRQGISWAELKIFHSYVKKTLKVIVSIRWSHYTFSGWTLNHTFILFNQKCICRHCFQNPLDEQLRVKLETLLLVFTSFPRFQLWIAVMNVMLSVCTWVLPHSRCQLNYLRRSFSFNFIPVRVVDLEPILGKLGLSWEHTFRPRGRLV